MSGVHRLLLEMVSSHAALTAGFIARNGRDIPSRHEIQLLTFETLISILHRR